MYLRIIFTDRTTFELHDVRTIHQTEPPKEELVIDYEPKPHTGLLQRTFRWGDIKTLQIR